MARDQASAGRGVFKLASILLAIITASWVLFGAVRSLDSPSPVPPGLAPPMTLPTPYPTALPTELRFDPPRPPDPSPESQQAVADGIIAHLERVAVAFNRPQSIELGSSARVELLLSAHETIASLKNELRGPGIREAPARARGSDPI